MDGILPLCDASNGFCAELEKRGVVGLARFSAEQWKTHARLTLATNLTELEREWDEAKQRKHDASSFVRREYERRKEELLRGAVPAAPFPLFPIAHPNSLPSVSASPRRIPPS